MSVGQKLQACQQLSQHSIILLCVPESAHCFLVRRECFDKVHVGLPVLDHAVVISGDHPVLVVTPYHGAHCTVMGLDIV
jgi:hypothetical protein